MSVRISAGHGSPRADINVIPMIDVLLVLIVIFMLLQSRDTIMEFVVPPEPAVTQPSLGSRHIVLQLRADGSYAINGTPVSAEHLARRVTELYRERPVKLLFIQAAPQWRYQAVIDAADLARGAGVEAIGFMPYDGG